MTLATDWDFRDCRHWFWSEKFDGCRAYWDGHCFWTRGGHVIDAPVDVLRLMPRGVALDGELWAGRGALNVAMVATVHGHWNDALRFMCFDAPDVAGDWMKRMALADTFRNAFVLTPERGTIRLRDDPSNIAARIIAAGGEGLMLRNPNVTTYNRKRTIELQRIKAGNLYAPWHGARPQIKFRKYGGLDLRQWPFDPQMEYTILH